MRRKFLVLGALASFLLLLPVTWVEGALARHKGEEASSSSFVAGGGDSTVGHLAGDDTLAANEFFTGALQRPLLQIIKPFNGQVLDSGEVEILVDVSGYELPSKLHDSRVCLGIASQGQRVMESCFEQSPTMEYVVSGLTPGQSFMLRVVLFERSNALAVSVRSFRVGGVSISSVTEGQGAMQSSSAPVVTIQTALQLAVEHQNTGKHQAAEEIYRQIIEQHPDHPDALHLLGLVLYQKGDPEAAILYLERAIHSNSTFEVFHNSLGECLRAVGRVGEAISHFSQALAIQSDFLPAKFNLGLSFQQMHEWSTAIQIYDEVSDFARRGQDPYESQLLQEARIRQCDLLQALGDYGAAQECWENGLRQWPTTAFMYNELGNLHVQLDNLELAAEYYETALYHGMDLAELNIAIVRELEGKTRESVERYDRVLRTTRGKGLPDTHIMIKMATVLPRVMPGLPELMRFRRRFDEKLDELLSSGFQTIDNSEPIKVGFSLGFHLGFHGESNVGLKSKLSRVYMRYCPALLTGRFLSEDNIILQSHLTLFDEEGGHDPLNPSWASNSNNNSLLMDAPTSTSINNTQSCSNTVNPLATSLPTSTLTSGATSSSRPIRVGFISRFFYNHAIGIMTEGIIQHLPRPKFKVMVFMIEPEHADDEVSRRITNAADKFFVLPGSLNMCADVVRQQHLDILIYPEIGTEPVSYFLAFSRLAPVQAAWWGHPDTTGIPTIDYFISSDVEVPTADKHYSERLYRMAGLGAYFFRPAPTDVKRAALRQRIQAELHLPSNVHFYLCPQALFKFHPSFDDVLVDILAKDKLGYLFLLNSGDRQAWSKLLLSRMQAKMKEDQIHRVLFYTVTGDEEMLSLYILSDVVLDTFPVSGYINSLQAFAVGAPVITLPGDFLSGRVTLSLYQKMGIMDCVAKDAKDYVNLALHFAHNKLHRSKIVSRILASSYRLFEDPRAIDEWDKFLSTVTTTQHHHHNISTTGNNNQTKPTNHSSELDQGMGEEPGYYARRPLGSLS